jgi:hypothetical protein
VDLTIRALTRVKEDAPLFELVSVWLHPEPAAKGKDGAASKEPATEPPADPTRKKVDF